MVSNVFDRTPRVVGDYTLVPHGRWKLYTASRPDGHEVPKPLTGQFTDPDDFRKAAEAVHGDRYGVQRIAGERKDQLDALAIEERSVGVRRG